MSSKKPGLRRLARALVLCLWAGSSFAHHGGAVEWQDELKGPISGSATEFQFRFPHVVVRVDIDDGDGVKNWGLTTRWTPTILRQHGWNRNSIKPGDQITVTYVAHVTDPTVIQMRTIEVNGVELPLQF